MTTGKRRFFCVCRSHRERKMGTVIALWNVYCMTSKKYAPEKSMPEIKPCPMVVSVSWHLLTGCDCKTGV